VGAKAHRKKLLHEPGKHLATSTIRFIQYLKNAILKGANMTDEISIYATKVITEGEQITLSGFDTSQIVAEFNVEELLECMELSDIADYLTKKTNESLEDDSLLNAVMNRDDWQGNFDAIAMWGK